MDSDVANGVLSRLNGAKLQTTFDSDDDPQVVHLDFQNTTVSRPSRKEQWMKRRLLGSGGFGSVLLEICVGVTGCEDGQEDKTVKLRAVKRLQKPQNGVTLSAELLRELNTLLFFSDIKYEFYFVETFGWYESSSTLFIAMKYFPLGDMQSHLLDNGRVPEKDAKSIRTQILRGLEFMHGNT